MQLSYKLEKLLSLASYMYAFTVEKQLNFSKIGSSVYSPKIEDKLLFKLLLIVS